MEHLALIQLSAILVVGVVVQWIAWRFRLPSILLLLLAGVTMGPVTGMLDPEHLFGELLLPLVSISVAVILFEGGLSLRLAELPVVGAVALRLVTLGVLITLFIATVAARYCLGLNWPEAVMLGAILVVTGPTVIGPLLRHIRPAGAVGPLLKWEGITIDPVGAMLALLIFEALISGANAATGVIMLGVLKTILVGTIFSVAGAATLVFLIKRHWIPDPLQVSVTFVLVIGANALSNYVQHESGLLTVTLMGIFIANQRDVAIRHLVEFKENLQVLILAFLFIVLSARLDLEAMRALGWGGALFLLVLIAVARPLTVVVCSFGSKLNWRERLFLMAMAPRGIVAAAISSVFALRLSEAGYAQAEQLMPATFLVIFVTVLVYSLTADLIARKLGLGQSNPQGVVIVGAHLFARQLAQVLQTLGFKVQLIDKNWANVTAARQENLKAHYADALSESLLDELQLDAMGKMIALTANEETNALAAIHFGDVFGRSEVYQLSNGNVENKKDVGQKPLHLRGRILFGKEITYDLLMKRLREGSAIKVTKLSEEFDFDAFKSQKEHQAIPLLLVTEGGKVQLATTEKEFAPQPGQRVVSLTS